MNQNRNVYKTFSKNTTYEISRRFFGGDRVVPRGETDGRTDFTRQIFAFRNCSANAPKNEFVGVVSSGSSTKGSEKK